MSSHRKAALVLVAALVVAGGVTWLIAAVKDPDEREPTATTLAPVRGPELRAEEPVADSGAPIADPLVAPVASTSGGGPVAATPDAKAPDPVVAAIESTVTVAPRTFLEGRVVDAAGNGVPETSVTLLLEPADGEARPEPAAAGVGLAWAADTSEAAAPDPDPRAPPAREGSWDVATRKIVYPQDGSREHDESRALALGFRRLTPVATALGDASGRFSLAVPVGACSRKLIVEAHTFGSSILAGERALTGPVLPGEILNVGDVEVGRPPQLTVFVHAAGGAFAGATVRFHGQAGRVNESVTDASGLARTATRSEVILATVSAPGYATVRRVWCRGQDPALEVDLGADVSVSGTVFGPVGLPLAHVAIAVREIGADAESARVGLADRASWSAETDDLGQFTVGGLSPKGRYELSATPGDRGVLTATLAVEAPASDVRWTLPPAGSLEVDVQVGGDPAASDLLSFAPSLEKRESGGRWVRVFAASPVSPQAGETHLTFSRLEPGVYRVASQLGPVSEPTSVETGAQARVKLSLDSADVVTARTGR